MEGNSTVRSGKTARAGRPGKAPGVAKVHVIRSGDLPPVDPAAVRKALEMTQEEFAAVFSMSPSSVQSHEQGHRNVSGATLALYTIILHEPAAAIRAMKKARTVEEY